MGVRGFRRPGLWQAAHKISRRCEEIYINFRSIEGVRQRHKPSHTVSRNLLQVWPPASIPSTPLPPIYHHVLDGSDQSTPFARRIPKGHSNPAVRAAGMRRMASWATFLERRVGVFDTSMLTGHQRHFVVRGSPSQLRLSEQCPPPLLVFGPSTACRPCHGIPLHFPMTVAMCRVARWASPCEG